jgi:Tol biopolymer transport system component
MIPVLRATVFLAVFAGIACAQPEPPPSGASLVMPGEIHFANLRQLTFGGQNAEGYFSFDEQRLIFQSTRDSFRCDQQFIMDVATGATRLVSTGAGRTTCGYFFPGDKQILFSSTHASMPGCPPEPDHSKGYVWAVYAQYDIYAADADGGNLHVLSASPGYDAEATVSPAGNRIVFTSTRNGDLDLYSMNLDGSDVRQLTSEIGYDGGAFYSWDGKKIVFRGWHDKDSAALASYRALLATHVVRPSRMELFVMNADGSGRKQITDNGAANFGPFFHPDDRHIIFASNMHDPRGRNFDLYMIGIDGKGLERITTNESFDGFPMFTRDGRHLVFASNRNGKVRGETNLFLADWVDGPPPPPDIHEQKNGEIPR